MEPFYTIHLTEQRGPSQTELRKSLERRAGDIFLVKQPDNRSFPATHQRHTRGIWTESMRKDLLKQIRASSGMMSSKREALLRKLWRENDMAWMKAPFEALRRAVIRAQNMRMPVTREVNERISREFPGTSRLLRLLDQDRIVNRGNAHMEIRSLAPDGRSLIGFTLDTPGAMIQNLKSGKVQEVGRNKLTEFGGGRGADRIQVQKKSLQPLIWLRLVTKDRPVFEADPGDVGATETTAGRFDAVTGGGKSFQRRGVGRVGFSVVYGIRRSNFHEQFHFYEDPALHRKIGGRWTFRLLKLKRRAIAAQEALQEQEAEQVQIWLARRTDDQRPFIFRNDFQDEVDQARREKTDLIWNLDAVKVLQRMNYFRDFDLLEELENFKESDRSKKPPRGGIVRFRPKGRLAKVPPIFSESTY